MMFNKRVGRVANNERRRGEWTIKQFNKKLFKQIKKFKGNLFNNKRVILRNCEK